MTNKRPRLKPLPRTGHSAPRTGRTKRISAKRESLICERLAGDELTQHAIAAEVGVSRTTVCNVAKRDRERIEQMRDKITNETLDYLDTEGQLMREGRGKDAKNSDSNTGAQSFRVLYEAGGLIGKGGGFHINIDNRSLNVTLDADKMAAMKAMTGEDRHKALQKRLAKLRESPETIE